MPVEPPTGLYGDAFGIHNINERNTMNAEQSYPFHPAFEDAMWDAVGALGLVEDWGGPTMTDEGAVTAAEVAHTYCCLS